MLHNWSAKRSLEFRSALTRIFWIAAKAVLFYFIGWSLLWLLSSAASSLQSVQKVSIDIVQLSSAMHIHTYLSCVLTLILPAGISSFHGHRDGKISSNTCNTFSVAHMLESRASCTHMDTLVGAESAASPPESHPNVQCPKVRKPGVCVNALFLDSFKKQPLNIEINPHTGLLCGTGQVIPQNDPGCQCKRCCPQIASGHSSKQEVRYSYQPLQEVPRRSAMLS